MNWVIALSYGWDITIWTDPVGGYVLFKLENGAEGITHGPFKMIDREAILIARCLLEAEDDIAHKDILGIQP